MKSKPAALHTGMAWIQNLIKRSNPFNRENVSINEAIDILGGETSFSGVRITDRSALGNPAVWKGIQLISQSVAKLPLLTYRRGDNDSRERATEHPAYRLLKRSPNDHTSHYIFKQSMMQNALLHGNAYAWISRDGGGNPIELIMLDSTQTFPARENGQLLYVTTVDGEERKLRFSDVLHIKGLSPDGLIGWSVIDVMKDALGLGLSVMRYSAVYFKNAAKPSVVIELPPNIRDKEKIEQFRHQWGSMHQGLTNSHRPALLTSGAKVIPISNNNEESQLSESMENDRIMVSNILSIPPHMLGANISTSHSSLESESKSFLSNTLDGWLHNWESECSQKLLTEEQKENDSHFMEFERKAIISIDATTQSTLAIQEYNNGIISFEELRAMNNRPTVKDPSHTFRRPANILVEGEEPEPEDGGTTFEQQPQDEPQDTDGPADDEPATEDTEDDTEPLRAITAATLQRLVNRMAKGKDIEASRSIMLESFEMFPAAEQFTDDLLTGLAEELQASLPEQRASVFSRIDIKEHTERLINGKTI